MKNPIKSSLFGLTIKVMAYSVVDETRAYHTNQKKVSKNKMSENTWATYKGQISGFRFETKADSTAKKCPTATKDVAVNLRNRGNAIKTAMYGPLNPAEPNEDYWKKLGKEWDVDSASAKKQLCGNCSLFIKTPSMMACIESGVTGGERKDEWEAIDGAGQLGYCEAFDFKCASKRTCRAWVTGGPITQDKKK